MASGGSSPNDSFYNIVMTELKKHEPTLEEKNVKFTKGGLSADLVAIGKKHCCSTVNLKI